MAGRIRINPPSLDARALQQLQSASPTANDILSNLEDFNEEISAATGEEIEAAAETAAPVQNTAEVEMEDELDRINRELEEKLQRQKELEAARAAEEQAETQASSEQPEEVTIEDRVRQMLAAHPNAPSEAQIEAWKKQLGNDGVQVLAMGEGDIYVFTYLRRASFQKIQAAMAKQAQIEGMAKDPEEFMMEQVLKQCVLWPKLQVEFFYNSRSGVIPTLYSSVMLHSYHLTPQQAMVITAQL